jgi:transcription elongation GreA/GreB family factor
MTLPTYRTLAAAGAQVISALARQQIQPLPPWRLADVLAQLAEQRPRSKLSQSGIVPGCSVFLLDLTLQQSQWLTLLSPAQTEQPEQGLISVFSPLGAALLGKQSGDRIELQLCRSRLQFQVLDVLRVQCRPASARR